MRPKKDILDEVVQAAGDGHREIQLLGQIVNHYQAPDDPSFDFAALLEAVHDVPGVERIRFASPHPRHVPSRLIEAVRDLPKVCKHFHLPVQSGSTRVLSTMRRRYTRESYLELVSTLRDAVPGIMLSTDVIVGFPGETDADFDETMSLARAVRYESMFSFKYSPRPNTLARQRYPDDVSEEEKTRRIVALQAQQREIQLELHHESLGSVMDVLVDSVSRRREWEISGRTTGNTVVNFPGRRPGLAGWCPCASRGRVRSVSAASQCLTLPEPKPSVKREARRADRNDNQGTDGRSSHQHADHSSARCGRAEGAADLGGDLRSERHCAADRERQHAASDDARSAQERHQRSQRGSAEDRRLRPQGQHVFRAHLPRRQRRDAWRSTRVQATRLHWRCARGRRSSSRSR